MGDFPRICQISTSLESWDTHGLKEPSHTHRERIEGRTNYEREGERAREIIWEGKTWKRRRNMNTCERRAASQDAEPDRRRCQIPIQRAQRWHWRVFVL